MKKLHYILLITVGLLVSNCDTNDDGFYNNVYTTIPNLVVMDAHPTTYNVGENLYITADFSRYLNEGSTILDAYETTGATDFTFSYLIEKQDGSGNWQSVSVNDNQLDVVRGTAQNNPYVLGTCEYNAVNEMYEYRVGFPLLTAGTYRLSYGYNSSAVDVVEMRSSSPPKRLVLNINSVLSGVDSEGFYHFTVN